MNIEERLTALERRANRYRSALVLLVVTLAGVLLMGATAADVQDVVTTRELVVLNAAGQVVMAAGADEDGHGSLSIQSRKGKQLITAGADANGDGYLHVNTRLGRAVVTVGADGDGHGRFTVKSRRGQAAIKAGIDLGGNGVVEVYNRKGEVWMLKPVP